MHVDVIATRDVSFFETQCRSQHVHNCKLPVSTVVQLTSVAAM